MIDEAKMLDLFRGAVDAAGSQKAWATANGFSPTYVCDVLKGYRRIGSDLASALGYEVQRVFRKSTPAPVREHTPALKILQGESKDA